ncbi:MAG: hypothetical protein ACTS85_02840 [Arsenophonus sp. NC-PG7-MAG3]
MSRLAKKITSVSVLIDVVEVALIKLNKLKLISFSKVNPLLNMHSELLENIVMAIRLHSVLMLHQFVHGLGN